jgi:diketogulonate reductase-like aldo/keto reductase
MGKSFFMDYKELAMEYKELGKGVRVPVLGLGTWGVGGRETADYSQDKAEIAALTAGIELGMTHIDTAEFYAAGHCEELVGRAIKPYERSSIFLTTKVWSTNLRYNDLIKSIKSSLKRLEVDYVDLYLIHWPNPAVPLQETMKALEHCVEEGYTRFIGVSNFSTPLLAEAQSHLKDHRVVANQVEYNLLERGPERELLPYCQENGVILIAYQPLARGSLARPGNAVLDELARKYGKTQSQVSLNWLISQEKVITIPKASQVEHIRDNRKAIGWRLSGEDFKNLSRSIR